MRSDMLKNNYSHVEQAIELIEEGIREKLRPTEISVKLQANLMPDYKYFNAVFSGTTGYTLAKYIRRRVLAVIYETWKNERPVLCKTSIYEGYPRFLERFQIEFGITIEEAVEKGYTESQLQCKLDITNHVKMFDALDEIKRLKLIKDYTFNDKQKITMEFNVDELLLFFLQMKVYLLVNIRAEEFEGMSEEDRAMYVIAVEKWCQEHNKGLVTATYKEIEEMKIRLIDYEFCGVGEVLVVYPKLPDELMQVFLKKCDELIPYMYTVLPGEMIPQALAKELSIIEESKNIDELSKGLKLSLVETRELLWQYLAHGYLRADIIK